MKNTSVMLLACAFAAGLSGCSRIEEAAMPVAAKVNAAYPPSPELLVARERLMGMVGEDAKQVEEMRAQIESRMALRGLTCSQQVSVGRLDSVASVKAMGLDQTCFQQQDQIVMDFLGTRAVGVLMSLPPLRPLKPATPGAPLQRGPLSHINDGTFASQAGVAVLYDGSSDATVVELPAGSVIARLPRMRTSSWANRLSPNGRVLALQQSDGQGVVFLGTTNGHRLWDYPAGQKLLAWLPEVTGFVMAERNGATMLADGLKGTLAPHPLAKQNSEVATSLPGGAARILLGSSRELVLMEHQRTPAGLKATEVRRLNITGRSISSGQPVPMQHGKMVVFNAHPDIGWLNLESGESGTYRISPTFADTFAKLDENRLLVDSPDLVDHMRTNPWVFDITRQLVAPVDPSGIRGILIQTGERKGFMRRSQDSWVADDVKTTREPVPFDQVAAEYELQVQLAKLQAQAAAQQAQDRLAAASGTAGVMAAPIMTDLPRNAVVQMIGAYEGSGSDRAKRSIRVVVRPSPRPLVLALSSYESVRWVIVNQGAKISAVLLSGYEPSTVIGLLDTPVQRIGNSFAYKAGSAEHMRWRQEVQQYTGPLDIRSFQGQYTGSEFSVGGS